MTLKFTRVRAVVEVHVRAKFHQAECSGSAVIVLTNFCVLSRNGKEPLEMQYIQHRHRVQKKR